MPKTANLMIAHRQWATRPADQRYETLAALYAATHNRRMASQSRDLDLIDIQAKVETVDGDDKTIVLTRKGATRFVEPTHWAFGQMAGAISAPSDYLRTLPPDLAVQNLNFGIQAKAKDKGQMKFLTVRNAEGGNMDVLQAVTSPKYGRVFDADVVQAAMKVVDASGGKFFNPKAYVDGEQRPSGLYASDHDVFMFLIDGGSFLDVGPRAQLNRGFILWNSEVGAKTIGWMTFLHNGVCGNHIIWGASNVRSGRIIHRLSAPSRFQQEAMPALLEYVNAAAGAEEVTIRKAQDFLLPAPGDDDKALIEWLMERRFTKAQAVDSIDFARREEGDVRTLWQIVQGATAAARDYAFVDARVEFESKAGDLLNIVK